MKHRRIALAALVVAGALASLASCTGEDPPIGGFGGGDAGAGPDSGGGGGDGGPCTALHVSAAATPGGDGCTPDGPLGSIGAALAAAKLSQAADSRVPAVKDILVCQGAYREALIIDFPVSLHGGLDCRSYRPDPARVYPDLGRGFLTSIFNASWPSNTSTVTLTGSAVDASVIFEGFSVLGGPEAGGGNGRSIAIAIERGASPIVRENLVTGGSSEADGPSVGIAARATDPPVASRPGAEILHNVVRGGSSRTPARFQQASVGVSIRTGDLGAETSLHDNTIEGGSGEATGEKALGSVGLLLFGEGSPTAPPDAPHTHRPVIANNVIRGGSGTASHPDWESAGSVGVYVLYSGATFTRNTIEGGTGNATTSVNGDPRSSGEAIRIKLNRFPVFLAENRLLGGQAASATMRPNGRVLVATDAVSPVELKNNFLLGGGDADRALSDRSTILWTGLATGADLVTFRNNTIALGNANALLVEDELAPGRSHVVLQNNLVVGRGSADRLFRQATCGSKALVSRFENNVFIDIGTHGTTLLSTGGNPATCPDVQTIETLETHLGAGTGNRVVALSCAGQGSCTPCTAPNCAASVIGSWGTGYTSFLAGWKLEGPVACAAAAKAGKDLRDTTDAYPLPLDDGGVADVRIGNVSQDFFGNARTPPFSAGAHELEGGP